MNVKRQKGNIIITTISGISWELLKRVDEVAEAEHRSRSAQILVFISEGMANYESKNDRVH